MQHQHPGPKTARLLFPVCSLLSGIAGSALTEMEDAANDGPDDVPGGKADAIALKPPAGDLPATRQTAVDGHRGAILPNGRLITPLARATRVCTAARGA
jgi:hypothetical protein